VFAEIDEPPIADQRADAQWSEFGWSGMGPTVRRVPA
jgi:hypothetical protein